MLGESSKFSYPTGKTKRLGSFVVLLWLVLSGRRKWPLCAHVCFPPVLGKEKKPPSFWTLSEETHRGISITSSQRCLLALLKSTVAWQYPGPCVAACAGLRGRVEKPILDPLGSLRVRT